jgi:hypothetical protein
MNPSFTASQSCPQCAQDADVEAKLLLVNPARISTDGPAEGGIPEPVLTADALVSAEGPVPANSQFVQGYFCRACGIGFVSAESLREPEASQIHGQEPEMVLQRRILHAVSKPRRES